jgi:hypothetical protein
MTPPSAAGEWMRLLAQLGWLCFRVGSPASAPGPEIVGEGCLSDEWGNDLDELPGVTPTGGGSTLLQLAKRSMPIG